MVMRESRWVLVIILCWILLFGPGRIEGHFFPAAAPMELTRIIPTSFIHPISGETRKAVKIWGKSSRLRPWCRYRDMNWYQGPRNANNVPALVVVGPPKNRPNGGFEFGPWTVEIHTLSEFLNNSFSDAKHRCFWFGFIPSPWLTFTPFWR